MEFTARKKPTSPKPEPLVVQTDTDKSAQHSARKRRPRFSWRNRILISVSIALVSIATATYLIVSGSAPKEEIHTGNVPEFAAILPNGKSIDSLGGWKKVSPPKSEPVFAYTDHINGIASTISQQSLPASFTTSTDAHVAELAKSYNATNKIKTGSTTVYVGTSIKGPQSIIFTKASLLVLIKTKSTVQNDALISYINDLRAPDVNGVPKY